jgi:hypothetical protein
MGTKLAAAASRRSSPVWLLGGVSGAALVAGALVFALALGGGSRAGGRHPLPPVVSAVGLAERSGVRVVRIAVTGGGGLLDVRYEVIDPGRAAGLHDAATPPAVVDERTGAPIEGLLMGHAPHSRPKAGVTSVLIFVNAGNLVRRGDRVSLVLGGARLEHVVVQ